MTGIAFNRNEIQSLMSAVQKAVEDLDGKTTIFSTETELQIIGRERARYSLLYQKLERIFNAN